MAAGGQRFLVPLGKQRVNVPEGEGGQFLKIAFYSYCEVLPGFPRQWWLLAGGGVDLTCGKLEPLC